MMLWRTNKGLPTGYFMKTKKFLTMESVITMTGKKFIHLSHPLSFPLEVVMRERFTEFLRMYVLL